MRFKTSKMQLYLITLTLLHIVVNAVDLDLKREVTATRLDSAKKQDSHLNISGRKLNNRQNTEPIQTGVSIKQSVLPPTKHTASNQRRFKTNPYEVLTPDTTTTKTPKTTNKNLLEFLRTKNPSVNQPPENEPKTAKPDATRYIRVRNDEPPRQQKSRRPQRKNARFLNFPSVAPGITTTTQKAPPLINSEYRGLRLSSLQKSDSSVPNLIKPRKIRADNSPVTTLSTLIMATTKTSIVDKQPKPQIVQTIPPLPQQPRISTESVKDLDVPDVIPPVAIPGGIPMIENNANKQIMFDEDVKINKTEGGQPEMPLYSPEFNYYHLRPPLGFPNQQQQPEHQPPLYQPIPYYRQTGFQRQQPVFMNPYDRGFQFNNPGVETYGDWPLDNFGGFQPSHDLLALRRSIWEESQQQTTTPWSLPSFDIPSIDYSQEGCQTRIKEISQHPTSTNSTSSMDNPNNGEKSVILTRECFFPNGVPKAKASVKEFVQESVKSTGNSIPGVRVKQIVPPDTRSKDSMEPLSSMAAVKSGNT